MINGGDTKSKTAHPGDTPGRGDLPYAVLPKFYPDSFIKKEHLLPPWAIQLKGNRAAPSFILTREKYLMTAFLTWLKNGLRASWHSIM